MRHRIAGKKLGRTSAHRQALMRNLSISLIEKERIKTTLVKAKVLRRFTEKLITLSKKETLHARRTALKQVPDKKTVAKLFDTLSARYTQRPGGYTRILKLGPRRGDNAEMALIEFVTPENAVEKPSAGKSKAGKAAPKRKKKTAAKSAGSTARKKAPAKKTKTAKTSTKKAATSKKQSKSTRGASTKKG